MGDDYEVTIGLEVHVQLNTLSKMFCACAVSYGDEPNSHTCPVCLGLPGALPVLNGQAIESTVKVGLMLACKVPELTKWDRKNYFYPDMPKDYQISQYDLPLCEGGEVPLYELAYPKDHQKQIASPGKKVGLTRIHLEEDVAKSTHGAGATLIDFNRAGTPLMEIVSEPEIGSAEEAVAYLNSLRQIIAHAGVSDADMEKGQLRCDVNLSVRQRGQQELGAKVELKNLNSVSAVRRAIHHEAARQVALHREGRSQEIRQSTRRWNDDTGTTEEMRSKESAHDYRYFPDPDLLPVRSGLIRDRVASSVPETPHAMAGRFVSQYGVTGYDAGVLSAERELAIYFEQAVAGAGTQADGIGKQVANWVINRVLAAVNGLGLTVAQCPVEPHMVGKLVALVGSGALSQGQARELFDALVEDPGQALEAIIEARGFKPVDSSELEGIIGAVLSEFPDKVEEFRAGNEKVVNWLTGQVMKRSGGKANAKEVTEQIKQRAG